VAGCPLPRVTWYSAATAANALSKARGYPECYSLGDCTGQAGQIKFACANAALTTPTIYECLGYRLPTQLEWEYAYRAGTQTAYYSGDVKDNGAFPRDTLCYEDPALSKIGWYCFNAKHVQPSRCREPNRWGFYDMAGNVPEWMSSWQDLHAGPVTDPQGTWEAGIPGLLHSTGGSISLWPAACAAALSPTATPGGWSGFRLVRTLPP
jgi:formylglycine-generating enzyme